MVSVPAPPNGNEAVPVGAPPVALPPSRAARHPARRHLDARRQGTRGRQVDHIDRGAGCLGEGDRSLRRDHLRDRWATVGILVQRGTGGEEICEVLAANPRLEIVPVPVAAPVLNPQEQVWKATREAVPHNHTDLQLSTLARRFKAHLTHTTFPVSFLEHRGC